MTVRTGSTVKLRETEGKYASLDRISNCKHIFKVLGKDVCVLRSHLCMDNGVFLFVITVIRVCMCLCVCVCVCFPGDGL